MTRSESVAVAASANRRSAQDHAEAVGYILRPLAEQGLSLRDIAKSLEAYRIRTRTGTGRWTHRSVRRVMDRLGL